jgi:hypothetical protein
MIGIATNRKKNPASEGALLLVDGLDSNVGWDQGALVPARRDRPTIGDVSSLVGRRSLALAGPTLRLAQEIKQSGPPWLGRHRTVSPPRIINEVMMSAGTYFFGYSRSATFTKFGDCYDDVFFHFRQFPQLLT